MVTSINSLAVVLTGLNPKGIPATELYGRINNSLLVKNASVRKLDAALAQDQTRLSGLGRLQSALANFQSLTQSISGIGLQTGATSGNSKVVAALTNSSAKAGSYSVEVKQLAQSQQLSSRVQQAQDKAIGSGAATTIKVELGRQAGSSFAPGGASKTITIDSSNNTLQGIAKAFEAAGLQANIVKSGSGYTLQVGGASGAANSLRISVAGDAALQNLLAYNPAGGRALTQTRAAQDASVTVDGKAYTSDSNVVTGAIAGTALALAGKGATIVVVAQDSSAISANVGNFVSGYNNLVERIAALKKDDLRADPALAQVQTQLSQLLASRTGELKNIGISQASNGTLKIDAAALGSAVQANPDAVAKLFTDGGRGLADTLGARIAQLVGANGSISKQKGVIDRGIAALASQKTVITKALAAQATALVAQYAQLSQDSGNTALPGLPGGGATSLFDSFA